MNQISRRKQILSLSLLALLIAGISCMYLALFIHLCCSSTFESYHSLLSPDCNLSSNTLVLEVGLFMLFGLILLFFLPPADLIPHLSEFIDSLFKPPQSVIYFS
jgi:hypothetical protein